MTSKLLRKPEQPTSPNVSSKYEKFGLLENPFPSEPYVNQDSTDKRVNGRIYETEIHKTELKLIVDNFLTKPQSDSNHLRLGYIIDTSYIGRGNGKSAFLLNLKQIIDDDFCLDLSNGKNKCFSVYCSPEPGGRTKTFPNFVDVFFQAIIKSGIIQNCLAILRLDSMKKLYPGLDKTIENLDDQTLVNNLNDESWLSKNNFDNAAIIEEIYKKQSLQQLPANFPLFQGRNSWVKPFISITNFVEYYHNNINRNSEKISFVFSHLVDFFLSAEFNGAYVLVDDFERIPDFQSERQKRDFAIELRSSLFDGTYTNARIGFYNFLLVFHAGVPRLIADAWAASGMDHRSPIMPKISSSHVVRFEKLSQRHASLLLKKYLHEYRVPNAKTPEMFPFNQEAIKTIGELSEYNAAKILKNSNQLLEKAAESEEVKQIDSAFVKKNIDIFEDEDTRQGSPIEDIATTDLRKKVRGKKS
jgi:hypothetical protein